jgi:ubiquinone/menaquinone biosynthesis C-methylase UbiE
MLEKEYKESFTKFFDLRDKITNFLMDYSLFDANRILDIPAGHGFFSIEIVKKIPKVNIIAIGLKNDKNSFEKVKNSIVQTKEGNFIKNIDYKIMDASDLKFPKEYFDFVVNFLGLEDINMTIGKMGLRKSIKEFVRVLKVGGKIQIAINIEGNQPDQILATEINQAIGPNAIFYPKSFYADELTKNGIKIINERWFYTFRKMTLSQAKEEIKFACQNTPNIFKDFNVRTVPFEKIWKKYKSRIKKYGVAFYSRILVLIGKK